MGTHSLLNFILMITYLFSCSVGHAGSADNLQLKLVSLNDGTHSIRIGDFEWLKTGHTWIKILGSVYSNADKSLKHVQHTEIKGIDQLGQWHGIRDTYMVIDRFFETSIRHYDHLPAIIFSQKFLNDSYGTSQNDIEKVTSGFPNFVIPKDRDDIGVYATNDYFAGYLPIYTRWNQQMKLKGGHKIGPMALFDKHGDVLVMSHFSNFMAASIWHDIETQTINIGPIGRAQWIPKDFTLEYIIYHSSSGINDAFMKWGHVIQKFYNTQSKKFAETDFINNYLGYWTDAGACYYYTKEDNRTYQETILDIISYLKNQKIPIGYMQYDSWWYYKDSTEGIMKWIPETNLFPNGLESIVSQTGVSAACHSRYWSKATPLAKENGGSYDFISGSKWAFPVDYNLWLDILSNAKKWGIVSYNQDWLAQMFEHVDGLQTNVTVGRKYMQDLGRAAAKFGINIEICTAYPRHTLAALEMDVVTINRVSYDNVHTNYNWRIGINSLWVYALGQTPFKDMFWTNSTMTCKKYGSIKEHLATLHSLVASLSAGPVGFGDLIGSTNKELLMRCCNSDGLILKPSRPATAINSQFMNRVFPEIGPIGEVWTTYSYISGLYFGIIFGSSMKNGTYKFTTADLLYEINDYELKIFDWKQPYHLIDFGYFDPLNMQNCSDVNFCLFYISPILEIGQHKIVILGELNKWIPMSYKRIDRIYQSEDMYLYLTGSVEETVYIDLIVDGESYVIECNLGSTGKAVIHVLQGSCHSY